MSRDIICTNITSNKSQFYFRDKNGQTRRPYLWEEVNHYYNLLVKNNIPNNTQTWIVYDMDRHQDERDSIFIYTFLHNLKSLLLRHNTITKDNVTKINNVGEKLVKLFANEHHYENLQNDLGDLKKLMDTNNIQPSVLKGQYRISADDLNSITRH